MWLDGTSRIDDGLCIKLDSPSNPNHSISSCELECGCLLAVKEGSNSNGAQQGVVMVGGIGNKDSIRMKVVVAW